MTASVWTEDRISLLKRLWFEGHTAEQVARRLANGISRSAVLGKVHRLGLSAGQAERRLKAAAPAAPRRPVAVRPDAAPVIRTFVPQVALEQGLATMRTVARNQCRWPFGEPGAADFSLCGRAVVRGSFCGAHAAMAYRPADKQGLEHLAALT